ncbi:glycosyltransferase family 2 protein [Phocaeicola vulgatus]|uniref:glycosyltransferase family 2 protein n=1 Tax=Phocaeicola vulgatus TaxID=821 RepID=UPI001E50209F|nr:glycosyltransferase [Phocaeicola vulgatus]BDC04434.1 glycosyl transferase [Phocaeicola vulgatus]BDC08539.1 glycosyl transferase [Phocaeicola vulgatus]BDC12563.1 glycosyl transferase [Phocaeicola vulgatus]
MKKISFILPIYNVAPYLQQCLDSILLFLQKGHQIILVNDGSTDDSFSIIKRFIQKNTGKDIVYVEHENGGLSAARNSGMEKVTGDYIWFIDTDDRLNNTAVQILEGYVLEQDVDLIILGRIEEFSNKSIYIPKQLKFKEYDNGIQYFEESIKQGAYRTQVWDKLFSRSLIEHYHFRFEKGLIYEDMFFMLQVLVNAKRTITYPLYPYIYNQMNTTSISKQVREKDLDILCFIEMADNYVDNHSRQITKNSLPYNLLIFNWVSTCLLNKYAKLSYTNKDALYIYEKARKHPIYQRAVKICMHNAVGIRRKVFAWLITYFPSLYKMVLIFAIWIKNIIK